MQTLIISATIVLLCLTLCYVRWRLDRNIHRLKMQLERNEQIYHFRVRIIYLFGEKAYNQLPHWEVMLNSDKPLVVKEWVEVDKLVNLN